LLIALAETFLAETFLTAVLARRLLFNTGLAAFLTVGLGLAFVAALLILI